MKLLLIDGNSLLNRAFYALPILTNDRGQHSNAVYGFCNILIKAIQDLNPTHIVVALDYGKKTFRNDMFADYKKGRKSTPDELKSQFPILKEVLTAIGISYIEQEGIEADDIIGTLSKKSQGENIIISGDRDLLQLINDKTTVLLTQKGISSTEVLNIETLYNNYHISPYQVIEKKALQGDSSDNIPGVAGIGIKTAQELLDTFGDVENIYNNLQVIKPAVRSKLEQGKEICLLSRQLATIKCDCDIKIDLEKCTYQFPFNKQAFDIFSEYNFRSFLKREEIFFMKKEQEEVEKKEINEDNLAEIITNVRAKKQLSFNFKNQIQIAYDENSIYELPNEITFFSDNIQEHQLFQALKPIFEDESIYKITCDLKAQMHIFECEYKNVFDIALAQYILNNFEELPQVNYYFSQSKELKQSLEIAGQSDLYAEIEDPLERVLYAVEQNGFKIDRNALKELNESMQQEKTSLSSSIYELAGQEFNINSPKQLSVILFERLRLNTAGNKKKSTNVDILTSLKDEHEIVKHILRYRKIQKIVGTYLEPYEALVKEKGEVIHTEFKQMLTSTGRLSSVEPNLQNIPVREEEGRLLRKLFISRFKNGYIVSADYNQIELRLLACFSGDKKLLNAFTSGLDVHTDTASKIFNKPYTEVTSAERRKAKAVNFGVIYGISDYGLSQNIGVSRSQAKEYIDKYFSTYTDVRKYLDEQVDKARKEGQVTTLFGRSRKVPEINASDFNSRSFGTRVAMNMPLQGSASDIIKLAMIKVFNRLKQERLQSLLILTIHDELIIDCPEQELEKVKQILKDEMEGVVRLQIPLTIEVNFGHNWYDCK